MSVTFIVHEILGKLFNVASEGEDVAQFVVVEVSDDDVLRIAGHVHYLFNLKLTSQLT